MSKTSLVHGMRNDGTEQPLQLDASKNLVTSAFPNPLPSGAVALAGSSGNIANNTASATLSSATGKTAYITGFIVSDSGATVGLPVSVTVTGLLGGTLTFTYTAIAGALLSNQPLSVSFPYPIPASATAQDITVSCPALGVGSTNNTVVAYGFRM